MNQSKNQRLSWLKRQPVVVSAVLALVGLMLLGLGWTTMMSAYVLILLSIVCGQMLATVQQKSEPVLYPPAIQNLLTLARDGEITDIHTNLVDALLITAQRTDPIFRGLALGSLRQIVNQTVALSEGTIEYYSTEAWRVAYEELLRSPGLHLYRSVSHIESVHYWQDGPGQQSTKLNLELQDSRLVSVERIAIIADHLWPADSQYPMTPIHSWLDEQHRHGIWVRIVRESRLAQEKDLQLDFGIYGSRAVGVQDSDVSGRTVRFSLNFDFERVQRAEEMWERLAVYSTSYRDLLDQQA